ncbi:MAG: ATP-binding protein [Firmicutes bacterium]|nr:ATP-binding protein [Bacillota bacterium]
MIERFSISIRDRHGFERSLPVGDTAVLGRHHQCDILLSDPMVSRQHVRIERVDGQWWAEDLGSSHGTYLSGTRITRAEWPLGSVLRLAEGAYHVTLHPELAMAPEVNLQAVLHTAQLLSGQVELDTLLEQTLDRLLQLSNTDRGFIMLPEDGELVIRAARNLSTKIDQDIQLSMSSVRRVYEKLEPIWIRNTSGDERLASQQSIMNLQLKTILCLPLMVQGSCIGVAYLDSQRVVLEPVDRPTFEAIVSLCAIAIERTRLAEDNLRHQVLARVGQVASAIVHDFKNALFVITGHAQMLRRAAGQDERLNLHVEQIQRATDHLALLCGDVLDYSKVREPQRECVDLRQYLEGLLEPYYRQASELGVALRVEGHPCEVQIDPHRFARVLENLLNNSLDALRDRSLEGLHDPGEIRIQWACSNGSLTLAVEDNGRGMPPKVQKRIFEPFFTYGKSKGTGLGLATVRKIVSEHGGSLEVVSQEGQGTTVTLHLPNSLKQEGEDTTGSHPAVHLEKP